MKSRVFSENCELQATEVAGHSPIDVPQDACPLVPIVEKLAAMYQKRYDLSDADRADLVQDGMIAAIAASKTYDASKAKLSTWIIIRVRGEMLDAMRKMHTAGITGDGAIEMAESEASSLDGVNFDPEDDENDADMLAGSVPTAHPDDDPVLGAEIAEMLDYLEEFDPQDQWLVSAKFGLHGMKVQTLAELGEHLQLSEQAVFKRISRILKDLGKKMGVDRG